MSARYDAVVNENLEWAHVQKNIDAVLKIAQETNAPGNDVFDSLKPSEERTKVLKSKLIFKNSLEALKTEILKRVENSTSNSKVFLENFVTIENRMAEMTTEAESIFRFFEKNQKSLAGERMATMDRKYALLQDSIGDLKESTRTVQSTLFQKQKEEGNSLKKIEFVFAVFIVLMVIGVALYGRKMSGFVEKTQLKESEQHKQIIAQQAVLTETAKMSALGVMAGGIAHELNNPLSIIVGRATQTKERLQKNQIPTEKVLEALEKIEKVSDRMAKIIHGIKTFSRDATHDPLKEESLGSLVEETLELCKEKLKKLDISIEVANFGELKIYCRATQISQVLLNLIGNSADAIAEQSERWIKIDFHLDAQNLVLNVTDSGKGIPPETAEKLMTPFFTTKEVGKGTGLGLSISKGILEKHNGSLTLNKAHSHTQFCLSLPLNPNNENSLRKAA